MLITRPAHAKTTLSVSTKIKRKSENIYRKHGAKYSRAHAKYLKRNLICVVPVGQLFVAMKIVNIFQPHAISRQIESQ